MQLGAPDLGADVDDRPLRLERLAHEREHGGTALEELDEAHGRLDLLDACALDETGSPAHEHLGPRLCTHLEQRLTDEGEERALARRQLGRLQPEADGPRPEPLPDDLLLEVLARPGDEARVDGLGEPEAALRHAARRRDDDDHHARRLERQHLDVADRGGLERRRRYEGKQPRRVRQHVRRRAQGLLDLVAHGAEVDAELVGPPFERVDQLLGVEPVAALRRRPPGRSVRVREKAERLELGELAANGRRRDAQPRALHEHARAHGLPRCHVLLDDAPQDLAFARSELHLLLDGSRVPCRFQPF